MTVYEWSFGGDEGGGSGVVECSEIISDFGAPSRGRTDTSLAGKRIFFPLRLSPPSQCAVCGLDYAFISVRWLPSSLYTFPSPGLVRRWHQHYLLSVHRI